jgi:NADPH-dependent glutamate synthase beta subunit-like oxidoreductase
MTTIKTAKEILIIGSSTSGLQATLDLSDSGISVHLVESEPYLHQNERDSIPNHILRTRILEIARHPNITLWTNTKLNRHEEIEAGFQVELHQQPGFVDLSRCTACGDCIEVCPVTLPGSNHKVIYTAGQPGCMTIDKVGQPPCSSVCPGGIHVQGYIALIAQGRFQEAIDLIREAIPFPGICGRVCTHPCEINCRRSQIDAPVSVRLLKRFVSDWEIEQDTVEDRKFKKSPGPQPTLDRNILKKVAIVGAGPGGMAAANKLIRKGYGVTVFEKLPVIGGMMSVGIPSYRLPREVIGREYQHIQDLGVEIKLNTTIGPDGNHSLDDLFEMGYGAVCLAVGAHKSQSLSIPGEDLPGVVHGIDVLKTISLIHQHDDVKNEINLLKVLRQGTNTRIAVLGGGNTAIDVARSLKRYNAQDVRILYRRTRAEMPAMPEEVEDAETEGIGLDFLVSPVRVIGDKVTGVAGLECMRMELGEPDASGRRRPVPIPESEFIVDLDLVVLAIGQKPDLDFLDPDHGIALTGRQRIEVADTNYMTSRPGVFAVGDAVTVDDMVVIEAIGMGVKAAKAIDAYLQGNNPQEIDINTLKDQMADREMAEHELVKKPRIAVPTIPLERRTSSFAEVELGYTPEQAMTEAQRCLACGPCSECQACVQVCKAGAINHDQQEKSVNLDVGAIIYAGGSDDGDDGGALTNLDIPRNKAIYHIPPDDSLSGSAAATLAYASLIDSQDGKREIDPIASDHVSVGQHPCTVSQSPGISTRPDRTGVFICQCGPEGQGEISRVIDTQSIRAQACSWPGVIHTQTLAYSCSPEGAKQLDEAVATHKLNRIVLASCSCCSIDQVCYSCTYQRIRCKDNLRLFTHPERSSALGTVDQATKFVLVNIREQCAWVHADDPAAATAKATALIAGSVARAMATPTKLNGTKKALRSALIFGNGAAADDCLKALQTRGIDTSRMEIFPEAVRHANGRYTASQNGNSWQASVLVLAPKNDREAKTLFEAFGRNELQPKIQAKWGRLETHRPGVYYIDPALEASISGTAAAGRAAAWLNRIKTNHTITSVVNSTRCRVCGTCVDICEFGAPTLIEKNGEHSSWIDPTMCSGCGTCVAHCPSGAIRAGYSTDDQIEAMLSVILAHPS